MNKNIVGLGDVYEQRRLRAEKLEELLELIDCADCNFVDDCRKQCRIKFYV